MDRFLHMHILNRASRQDGVSAHITLCFPFCIVGSAVAQGGGSSWESQVTHCPGFLFIIIPWLCNSTISLQQHFYHFSVSHITAAAFHCPPCRFHYLVIFLWNKANAGKSPSSVLLVCNLVSLTMKHFWFCLSSSVWLMEPFSNPPKTCPFTWLSKHSDIALLVEKSYQSRFQKTLH